MKRHITTQLITLAVVFAACWWGVTVRAERVPVDFVTVSGERMESTSSGSNRLLLSWVFTAETDSLRLTLEDKDSSIITVLYDVRLLDWDGSAMMIIPGAIDDPGDGDDMDTVGSTIFFNDEDFLIMRENALSFSMDGSDFDIAAAYGTGEVWGRFMKKISGTARIEKPARFSPHRMEIVVTEVFLSLPTGRDE